MAQSFDDDILRLIGRRHTSKQTIEAVPLVFNHASLWTDKDVADEAAVMHFHKRVDEGGTIAQIVVRNGINGLSLEAKTAA